MINIRSKKNQLTIDKIIDKIGKLFLNKYASIHRPINGQKVFINCIVAFL
jgi:hypothetical protein